MGDSLPPVFWFFLSYGLTVAWAVLFWTGWKRIDQRRPVSAGTLFSMQRLRWVGLAGSGLLVLVTLAQPALWLSAAGPNGLSGDSFFTLTTLQSAGLAALTTVLLFALFWLSASKSFFLHRLLPRGAAWRGLATLFDLCLTTALWLGATILAPQIYYGYYRMILSGLPNQWVIKTDLLGQSPLSLSTPGFGASLADLAVAASFWGLCLITFLVAWQTRVKAYQIGPSLFGFVAGVACALLWWRQFA
ncbi:MAG: hypothetical protein AAF530_02955 [Pseudomonadota bacterium]